MFFVHEKMYNFDHWNEDNRFQEEIEPKLYLQSWIIHLFIQDTSKYDYFFVFELKLSSYEHENAGNHPTLEILFFLEKSIFLQTGTFSIDVLSCTSNERKRFWSSYSPAFFDSVKPEFIRIPSSTLFLELKIYRQRSTNAFFRKTGMKSIFQYCD